MAQRPSTYVKCEDAPRSTTDERAGHHEPGYDGDGLWGGILLALPARICRSKAIEVTVASRRRNTCCLRCWPYDCDDLTRTRGNAMTALRGSWQSAH